MGRSLTSFASNTLPDGEYNIKITDVELKTAQSSGNEKAEFKGEVRGGPADRRKVTYSRSLVPTALGILANDLIAAGVDGEEIDADELFNDNEKLVEELQGFVGVTFAYEVSTRKYQGREYNDFKLLEPVGDDTVQLGRNLAGVPSSEDDTNF